MVHEIIIHIPDIQAGKTRISVKGGEPETGSRRLTIRRPDECIEVKFWNAS
ncbi:MAG: hypothetical protein HY042_11590 [Spirochaetia bacterium]|nr:hypothetical protein [Spirochaetia bacterium]